MASFYLAYVGKDMINKKTVSDLEKDVNKILKEYDGELIRHSEQKDNFGNHSISKLYEFEGEGCINLTMSSDRSVKIDDFTSGSYKEIFCDASITLIGFSKESEVYKNLDLDFKKLINVYHTKRV